MIKSKKYFGDMENCMVKGGRAVEAREVVNSKGGSQNQPTLIMLTCFSFFGSVLHILSDSFSHQSFVGQNTRHECWGTTSSTNIPMWF